MGIIRLKVKAASFGTDASGTEATGTEATGSSSGNDHSAVETMGTTDTSGQSDATGTGMRGGGIIPDLGERLAGAVETMV